MGKYAFTKAAAQKLPQWKEDAIVAAKELMYGDAVIQKITNAKNEIQVGQILCEARHAQ